MAKKRSAVVLAKTHAVVVSKNKRTKKGKNSEPKEIVSDSDSEELDLSLLNMKAMITYGTNQPMKFLMRMELVLVAKLKMELQKINIETNQITNFFILCIYSVFMNKLKNTFFAILPFYYYSNYILFTF